MLEKFVVFFPFLTLPPSSGVSKIVTVDVKGNAPLWLKIKDLVDGVTYNFRIRAKTFTYGPEVEANITTGPGEGLTLSLSRSLSLNDFCFIKYQVLSHCLIIGACCQGYHWEILSLESCLLCNVKLMSPTDPAPIYRCPRTSW